jgi:hypothetical protein
MGEQDGFVLMRADLEVEHITTPRPLRSGPVDGGDFMGFRTGRGDERVIANDGADDEKHVLGGKLRKSMFHRGGSTGWQAEAVGVHEFHIAVEPAVLDKLIRRMAQPGFYVHRARRGSGHVVENADAQWGGHDADAFLLLQTG